MQSLKQEHPSLKIYFLSDMYLSTAEVRELLASANALDVFDGGITSTEAKQAKFSGKLYHHIHQNDDVFGESFDIYRNLHIGDSEHSDVNMALSAGSFAHHLYEPRFRRLRTRYNKYRLAKISKQTVTQDKDTLDTLLGCSDNPSSANILSSYGKLFALPLYSYLHHIANLTDDSVCYLFVSSEANLFRQTGKKLFGSVFDTVKVAPTLNRKTAIKALIYAMLQSNRPEHLSAIINTVRLGEVHGSRADIYDFLLTSKYPYSEMVVNLQTESDFCDSLWQDLLSADAQYLAHLEDAYNRTMDYLAQSDGKDIVICDVGWGSTIQVLVSQLLELTGSAQRVSGLYMGTHPVTRFSVSHTQSSGYLIPNVLSKKYRLLWNAVLWEYPYTNKPLYYEDEAKLQHIRQGMQDTFVVISQFKSNPKTLFSEVVQPEIARLFTSPTRREAQVLGSIRLDWGMNASQSLYIIDTSHSTLGMYRQFLLRPKASLKKITAPNQWTTGYIYYYRLYGMSLLLKVIGRLKHKRYI